MGNKKQCQNEQSTVQKKKRILQCQQGKEIHYTCLEEAFHGQGYTHNNMSVSLAHLTDAESDARGQVTYYTHS